MINRKWAVSVAGVLAVVLVLLLSLALAPITLARPAASNTWTVGGACGATIQACVNTAANGDTVLVPSGTYVEFVRINHPVSLIGLAANGVRPTIKAPSVAGNIDPVVMIWSTNPMPVIDASTVISNLIITGGYSTAQIGGPAGGGLQISGERCSPTVRNVTISGNSGVGVAGINIALNAAPQLINVEIKNNTAYQAYGWSGGGAALSINGAPRLTNVLVANNQDNAGRGQIEVMSGSAQVLHSTIVGSGSAPGFAVDANATLYVTNTIITSHTIGISSTGMTYQNYNLFFGNGSDWSGLVAGATANVYANPGFVNPAAGNYHLVSTSRALDHGVNAGVTFDFDGEARPIGTLPDIGFDETLRIMPHNTWTVGGPCGTTIQACINSALEEDTILIPSAVYNEAVQLEKPVSLIGLNNSSGQRPTIRSSNLPLLVAATTSPAVYITSSTVISNLILTGGRVPNSCGGGLRLAQVYGSASPTLRDLIVTGNTAGAGAGICMYWGSSPLMINVVITGNTSTANLNNFGSGAALNINGSPRLINVLVANNQDNLGRGQIEVMGGAPQFLHNTIVGSGTVPAFWIDPSATLFLTNTIVASHTIGITSTGTVVEDYNLFFGNNTNRVGSIPSGVHDVYGAPAFANPALGDYHLAGTSLAINRGVNAGITFDVDGEVRPIGLGYDIGVDEAAIIDADGDGLTDAEEISLGTDPHNPDTDGDGLPDGWEVQHGLNPLNPGDAGADSDGDGLSNLQEYQRGTDPQDADTDHDGYSDGAEVTAGTNPLDPNSHPVAPPVIAGSVVTPQAGQIFSATQIVINGTASATNGVKTVHVSIDGASWVTATGTINWQWTWSTPLEDGRVHTLTARVRDSVGQLATLPPVNVVIDRVAPVAQITQPQLGDVIRSHAALIVGAASDGGGLARLQVSVDNGATWNEATPQPSWSWAWNIPDEDGVSHLLRVRATDRAGNASAPPASIAVFVDNVAPTLNYVNLPTSGQTTIHTTTLTVVGRSTGAITTTLDSGSGPRIVTVVGNLFTQTIDLMITGTHVITSTGIDAVGNLTAITSTLEVLPQMPPAPQRIYLPVVLRNFDPQRDRYEIDDTVADARSITTDGAPQRHNFYPLNDVDWVWFEVTPGTYIINATGTAADTDTLLRLYASNGVTKLAENDDCSATTRSSCLTWQVTTGGTLYLQIAPYDQTSSGAERWYDVTVVKQ